MATLGLIKCSSTLSPPHSKVVESMRRLKGRPTADEAIYADLIVGGNRRLS